MDDIAIVTGGAQGIGASVATTLAQRGVRVALWDVERTLAETKATELNDTHGDDRAFAVEADVANWESVVAARGATEEALGPATILVNSAGIAGPNGLIEDYPLADWLRVMEINATGSFHVLRALLPGMKARGYGRICLVASIAGKEGNPLASAYSASKAAVIGLTKSAGKESAGLDIAVNCVTPAAARTRIFDQMSEEHIDYMLSKIPRGRFLEVSEAAEMICWLVSKENSFATGGVFDLSGGRATY